MIHRAAGRLLASRAGKNAGASYFAFFSTSVCAFLSIPLAVAYLEKAQIGLWTVVNQVIAYLVWLDLGVGDAVGRKIADAVAKRDEGEMDRWWTLIRVTLVVQGIGVVLIGLALLPLAFVLFEIGDSLRHDALWLFVGAIVVTGINMPCRAVPGLMTAQERFHWIPFGQGLFPWVNLLGFWWLLRAGWGVKAYIAALAGTQLAILGYYTLLVRTGPYRMRWAGDGLTRDRFRSLFGFSLNLSVIGLVEAVLTSMPALILTRVGGGLASVPVFNFTNRGPMMLASLVRRTVHAFFPRLQHLHVSGEREAFRSKFRQVGRLTVAVACFGGGGALVVNRTMVELLAGPDFFAGSLASACLSLGVVTLPLMGFFNVLVIVSGSMGKSALVSLAKLIVGVLAGWAAFDAWGVVGLAVVFSVLPLANAAYAYVMGSRQCGFRPAELAGRTVLDSALVMGVVFASGVLLARFAHPGAALEFHGRTFRLPGWEELAVGVAFAGVGGILLVQALRGFRQSIPEVATVSGDPSK